MGCSDAVAGRDDLAPRCVACSGTPAVAAPGSREANDNWVNSPNKQAIIDTTIPPSNDAEPAVVRKLTPGNYTAIVQGANDTTGVALVEVYALQ